MVITQEQRSGAALIRAVADVGAFYAAPIAVAMTGLLICVVLASDQASIATGAFIISRPLALGAALALTVIGSIMVAGRRAFRRHAAPIEHLADRIAWISTERDFSARTEASGGSRVAKLSKQINTLLDQVNQRERSLRDAMNEIAGVRDRAEAASRAKSQFLANMSHELRTPLNAIIGYASMLQEDAATDKNTAAVSDLGRILKAAQHLLNLINDILDLSKIEAGKVQFEYRPILLQDIINETMTSIGNAPDKNRNKFDVRLHEQGASMVTDSTKLRQCLVNLLSNAFKFTTNGQVSLDISLKTEASGEFVMFRVADTGIGISADQQARLFESFAQADASTTRKFGGTGLGLAITRKIAHLMGGEVSVESEEGRGSAFTLRVPRQPATGVAIPELALAAALPDETGTGRMALVIDDDPSAVDLMTRWLVRLGYSVASAADGEQGLALARQRKPHLVLLDIHMPRRNGWDVLSKLKSDPGFGDVPVVIVSVDDERQRGIIAGASEYLTKPTTQEHLSRVLSVYGAEVRGQILIIDDDKDSGDLVERSAKQVGLAALRAFDGEEGLVLARRHKPAAIVLDLSMPRKDGFAVLAALGAEPELSSIPVIVVSARSLNSQEFELLSRAGAAFHAKGVASPFQIAANLVDVVGEKP